MKCDEPYDKLIFGKNECIKSCSETQDNKYEFILEKICLTNCPENFYEPHDKPFFCIPKCPIFRPFLLLKTLECVAQCKIKERQNKLCVTYYIFSKEANYQIFDEVIRQTRDELLNDYDPSVVDGGIINENGDNITITRTQQEDKNDDGIYLGECEERLKNVYNIPPTEALYVLRLDVRQIGYNISTLSYEILYPINGNKNLVKLNLSICSDINLNRTIDADIKGNKDKYNKNSPYYNDICYLSDSENGVDISLNDKKEDFIKNNLGVCEDECELISYNYATKKAVCSCGIKTEISLMSDIKIDKNALLNSFTNINNIANIKLMQCYNVIFQKKYILKNIGFDIYACLIISNLSCLIYFIIRDFKILIKEIDNIKSYFLKRKRKKLKSIETNNIHGNKKSRIRNINNKKYKKNAIHIAKKKKSKNIIPSIYKNKDKYKMNNKNMKKNNFKEFSNDKGGKYNSYRNKSYNLFLTINTNKLNKNYIINKSQKNKLLKLNYSEMNNLPFKEALSKDRRYFIQYYTPLIKTKHSVIYIFYTEDYNSKIIKVSKQIFALATLLSVNSLFFNDATMHKIYVDE